jgi:hypothetical protein
MVEIKIIAADDGSIRVEGPIENKVLCLGLLDIAHDTVLKYDPKQNKIIKPTLSFVPKLS